MWNGLLFFSDKWIKLQEFPWYIFTQLLYRHLLCSEYICVSQSFFLCFYLRFCSFLFVCCLTSYIQTSSFPLNCITIWVCGTKLPAMQRERRMHPVSPKWWEQLEKQVSLKCQCSQRAQLAESTENPKLAMYVAICHRNVVGKDSRR